MLCLCSYMVKRDSEKGKFKNPPGAWLLIGNAHSKGGRARGYSPPVGR